MTIQTIDQSGGALALAEVTGGSMPGLAVLEEWVTAAQRAESLVSPLVDTPFLPSSLWPLPPGVQSRDMPNPRFKHPRESVEEWQGRRQVACSSGTAAVLTGMTLGLDPLVALTQVFVVKGRPGLYVKIKVAIAQRAGHDVWDEEFTAEAVTVCGRRKGWPEDRIVRIRVTMDDAKRAEWTSNATYAKTPADMLWARAAGRVLDRIAADTLNGIPSVETIEDSADPVDVTVVEPAERPTASSILARAEAATPAERAPVKNDPEPTVAGQAETGEPISERTVGAINRLFVRAGVTGPGQTEKRQKVVEHVVQHPAESIRALTEAEGQAIVKRLTEGGRDMIATALVQTGFQGAEQPPMTPIAAEPRPQPTPLRHVDGPTPDEIDQLREDAVADYDPTGDADWPMDGAEAAAEGQ